ncbi:Farnesyl diphosphate synthase [Candidatus Kinetoplastibacterium sorsogonicusi]|uniref:Farnesyl diphosphate synthase n=1 Tax=Candidatus Kinetoplastidibacterium kentomonadis TaxID=1576550 RepID=A0A3Q8EY71_9PROT|nr:farnesyl diphosphate synthase [Candidatus Kinetoplastibacterium sorsogonicusi]AWD32478.1 Farnesyl diphosphate synthase [Candidatus Kinetoplastibacterium sorsogonicusi]
MLIDRSNYITFDSWKKEYIKHIDITISKFMPQENTKPCLLHKAMRYAVLNGGKRIRALLVYASSELCSLFCEIDHKEYYEFLDKIMVAIELIHAYSLIHDDLPCMDNDDLRRGLPSTHIKFNEALALLAGDALQALAFNLLSNINISNKDIIIESIQILSHSIGSFGMVGGQSIDINSNKMLLSYENLKEMHMMKTGNLISSSIILPSIICMLKKDKKNILLQYANLLGLAFQITDDILDITSETHIIGKTKNKDIKQLKNTYVSLLGVKKAKEHVVNIIDHSNILLKKLTKEHTRLSDIANFILYRNN